MAEDGRFYNSAEDDAYLGRWSAKDDALCFAYEGAPRESCFAVYRRGTSFDFYLPDLTSKVASTDCAPVAAQGE